MRASETSSELVIPTHYPGTTFTPFFMEKWRGNFSLGNGWHGIPRVPVHNYGSHKKEARALVIARLTSLQSPLVQHILKNISTASGLINLVNALAYCENHSLIFQVVNLC